jgi:cation transport ATPase
MLLIDILLAPLVWTPWVEFLVAGAILLLGRDFLAGGLAAFFNRGRLAADTFLALSAVGAFGYSFIGALLASLGLLDGGHQWMCSSGERLPQLFFTTAAAIVAAASLGQHLLARAQAALAGRLRAAEDPAGAPPVAITAPALPLPEISVAAAFEAASRPAERAAKGEAGEALAESARLDGRLACGISFALLAAGIVGLLPAVSGDGRHAGLIIGLLLAGVPGVFEATRRLGKSLGLALLTERGAVFGSDGAHDLLARTDYVAFKKSKTLSAGCPSLVDVLPLQSGISPEEMLYRAAALVYRLEHPIRESILLRSSAGCRTIPQARDYQHVEGRGVRAVFQGQALFLGNLSFLEERGVPCGDVEAQVRALASTGKMVLALAAENEVLGLLSFEDELRAEAREAVAGLRSLGVRTAVVSGDHAATLDALRTVLGLDDAFGPLTREESLALFRKLRQAGHRLALVYSAYGEASTPAQVELGILFGADRPRCLRPQEIYFDGRSLACVAAAARSARRLRAWMGRLRAALCIYPFAAGAALVAASGCVPFAAAEHVSPMLGACLTLLGLNASLLPAGLAWWTLRRFGSAR